MDIVQPFVAEYALTFPVLLDPDKQTYRLYDLSGVPETFIIGKDEVILLKIMGAQDWMRKEWVNYFDRITRPTELPTTMRKTLCISRGTKCSYAFASCDLIFIAFHIAGYGIVFRQRPSVFSEFLSFRLISAFLTWAFLLPLSRSMRSREYQAK